MTLYAETSALLSWFFGEARGGEVRRALDAIHLGTLLVIRTSIPDIHVLSLDDRVRDNARLLGISVLPT